MLQFHRVFPLGKLVLATVSCLLALTATARAEIIPITLLHLNDIYEITPIEQGQRGGMARVATLRKQLLARNPHTYTLLAGDAFSPSALGTAIVDGERLDGRQMVAVMNAIGFDYATLGNHEFDLAESAFLQRLRESRFQWLSANVFDRQQRPFPGVAPTATFTVSGPQGGQVRVGLIGVTIASNPASYVHYREAIATVQEQAAILAPQTDILIALTHLDLAQDQQLAATVPDLDLILGGHEHENMQQWRLVSRSPQAVRSPQCPDSGIPIFKADANARTVYIHDLTYDTQRRCLTIASRLQPVTAAIPDDPPVAAVVQQWVERGFAGFRAQGFTPEATIAVLPEALDGLESSVRNQPTNLTDRIAQAMLQAAAGAELAIFNSGSIRIDDQVPAGPITQYDVIRILPFQGQVLLVELPGELLQRVLEQGQANRGTGGFLQTAQVRRDVSQGWLIQDQPLQPQRRYRVAINDFLISGREQGLDFLRLDVPGVKLLAETQDIRLALIAALQATAPPP